MRDQAMRAERLDYARLVACLARPAPMTIADWTEFVCPHDPPPVELAAPPGGLVTDAVRRLQGLRLPRVQRHLCVLTAVEMVVPEWRASIGNSGELDPAIGDIVQHYASLGRAALCGAPLPGEDMRDLARKLRLLYDAEAGPLDRVAFWMARNIERLQGVYSLAAADHYAALSCAIVHANHGVWLGARPGVAPREPVRARFIADWWRRCCTRLPIAEATTATLQF